MPEVTVNTPSINLEAYFTFKEPINQYIKNKFNIETTSVRLKVVSVISMKDTIRNDLRDPFTDLYTPATISELEYKIDLLDNIPVVSFSYIDRKNIERYIRSPLNYIESISSITDIEYINKLIIIDLNRMPMEYNTTVFFTDLSDFIRNYTGVTPQIKETSIGDVTFVSNQEHTTRETIRRNMVTVHKTLSVRLEEVTTLYNQVLARLRQLKISLL